MHTLVLLMSRCGPWPLLHIRSRRSGHSRQCHVSDGTHMMHTHWQARRVDKLTDQHMCGMYSVVLMNTGTCGGHTYPSTPSNMQMKLLEF